MKKNRSFFLTGIIILFYIMLGAVLIQHSYSYLDPDLGWHLETGKEILASRALPGPNHNDYTLAGQPWVDHEWLANAGLYWLYSRFGYVPISLIFVGIILLAVFLLNRGLNWRRLGDSGRLLIMAFEFFAIVAMSPHLGVRLQEISILGLLLAILIFQKYQEKKDWKILLWWLPLFWLWACLHAGFLIGLAAIFIILGTRVAVSGVKREQWQLLGGGLGAVLATGLTPYGLRLYGFLGSYGNSFYMDHIQEWLPQWDFPYNYWQIAYLCLPILVIIFSLNYARRHPELRLKPEALVLMVIFWFLAIKSRRHLPLLVVVSWPIILAFLINFFDLEKNHKTAGFARDLPLLFMRFSLIFSLFSIAVLCLVQTHYYRDPFAVADKYQYPVAAINYLKSHPEYDNSKLLNDFGWGGFLIWTYPTRQLFIDGRLPQYPYAGHSLLEEYWGFFQDKTVGAQLIKYQISLVMMKPDPTEPVKLNWFEKYVLLINENEMNKNNQSSPLFDYLNARPNEWEIIYSDADAVIYSRQP
jgi:hypothetical protein